MAVLTSASVGGLMLISIEDFISRWGIGRFIWFWVVKHLEVLHPPCCLLTLWRLSVAIPVFVRDRLTDAVTTDAISDLINDTHLALCCSLFNFISQLRLKGPFVCACVSLHLLILVLIGYFGPAPAALVTYCRASCSITVFFSFLSSISDELPGVNQLHFFRL